MTFEEINNLTIEDVFFELLHRLCDFSIVPKENSLYQFDEDDSKSLYDRVTLHELITKPPLQAFEDELVEYKAELTAQEQARLDEVARVADIKSRFNAIKDIRGALCKANLDIPNPAIELKRIIDENDQTRLSLLESKAAEFDTEEDNKKAKQNRKKIGKIAREACFEILEVIAGHNYENGVTVAQKNQLEADYANILQALSVFRPLKAKAMILAVEPDGSIVTQQMKDEILEVYSKYGL